MTAFPMDLIDTHCHLVSPKLRDHAGELVAAAAAAGVGRILNIAYDPETIELALQQAQEIPGVFAAVGVQPHDASENTDAVAERVRTLALAHPKVAAIGEIGLDAYYTLSPMETQIPCFETYLDLACDVGLPVVVHVRETHAAVRDRMAARVGKGLRGVIHCFTGTVREAEEFLDLGFYISLSGIVTFKNSEALRDVARMVPSEKLLIETDSPYLAPIPHRGKPNQPAFVADTARLVAQVRDVSAAELAAITTRNALALFPKLATERLAAWSAAAAAGAGPQA